MEGFITKLSYDLALVLIGTALNVVAMRFER